MNIEEAEKRLKWYEQRYGYYFEKRGLRNVKNLFRKPNSYDWTILFMLLMSLFIAWAYNEDTKTCREYISKEYNSWMQYTNGTGVINNNPPTNYSYLPEWNFIVNVSYNEKETT